MLQQYITYLVAKGSKQLQYETKGRCRVELIYVWERGQVFRYYYSRYKTADIPVKGGLCLGHSNDLVGMCHAAPVEYRGLFGRLLTFIL